MPLAIMLSRAEYRVLTEQRVCVQHGCRVVPEKGIRCPSHAARHARYARERRDRLAALPAPEQPPTPAAPAPAAEGTP